MGIDGATGWLKDSVVRVMGSSTISEGSRISSCIGSADVDREGKVVSCGGDGVYGGDRACSIMMVENALASGSGSSMMLITVWATREDDLVQGTIEDIGYGFNTFTGQTLVPGFLFETSPMNANASISLTSFPDRMACYGSCGNIGNVLLFHSRGSSSSSTSESDGIWTFCFFSAGSELGPTPSSFPFFFRSFGGKR
jgi:hypothetical protein